MADQPVYLTTESSPSWRTYLYTGLIAFFIGCLVGGFGYKTATESDWLAKLHDLELKLTREQSKPPIIKEVIKTQTQTEIAYVPKETVRYIDPRTGREVTAKELESLELNIRPQEFAFSVNGKPATFKAEAGERWVFDNNKGKLDQWSTATIDIQVPTIDRTRKMALIPSVMFDGSGAQGGVIFVGQIGSGRIGLAGQVGGFSGGHYTLGVGASF